MEVDDIQAKTQAQAQAQTQRQAQVSKYQRVLTHDGSGWPSSRIVRVSRGSGGKDRHSKVLTSKGLRDRRVRLSVSTAIQFYDLQDRLGYDQPSKAVEWLMKAAAGAIDELPSLDPLFPGVVDENYTRNNEAELRDPVYQDFTNNYQENNDNDTNNSSTSETSKGSGLSLARSKNRIRARERAREMAVKKEKKKEAVVTVASSQPSSFADLLAGVTGVSHTSDLNPGVSTDSRMHWTTSPIMDYFQPFNVTANDSHSQHHHEFSFLQENYPTGVVGGGLVSSLNRGTLQSNLLSSLPHHHHHLGSTSANYPFFVSSDGYDSQCLQLYGGADHHKEKPKN